MVNTKVDEFGDPTNLFSVESFFDVMETDTLALFEHPSFEFLEEFDVFAPAQTERTREHEPPDLMRGFFPLLLQGHLRNSSRQTRTSEHDCLVESWLRSTAVERCGR